MILSPEGYAGASVYELLTEAQRGYVPMDHRLVRTLVERGDAVFPEFVRFLEEDNEEEPRVDLDELAIDLARHSRTPAASALLAEMARQYRFELPDELTEAFVAFGGRSVDTLLELHAESGGNPDVVFAMAGLGVRDPRILEKLIGLLETDPHEGAIAIGLYGDPAAKPALERALAAAGDDEHARRDIELAIRELDLERETEAESFDIWEHFPEVDTPFFPAFETGELLEFLASPVAEYRSRAVKMLTYDEAPPEVARRLLEVARTDSDTEVRAVAWESLEGLHEPAEIEAAVRGRLWDEAAPAAERAGAMVALAHEAEKDQALHRLIQEFYARPELRERAVRAMWHSGDRRFESRIPEAMNDPDVGVKRQAVTAAGMFSMVSLVGRIEKMFEDEDLRSTALYAYTLAAPSEVTPARMRKLYARIERLAGGLDDEESVLVGKGLDDRLGAYDLPPIFNIADDGEAYEDDEGPEMPLEPEAKVPKVGRNDPCPCGSGKKYKKCCGK